MPIGKTAFHVAPESFETASPPGLYKNWNLGPGSVAPYPSPAGPGVKTAGAYTTASAVA